MTASTRGSQATSQISASRPCSRSCGFLFESVVAGVSVSDIFAGIYYWLLDVKVARGDGKYELRIRKGGWWPWIPACAGRTGVGGGGLFTAEAQRDAEGRRGGLVALDSGLRRKDGGWGGGGESFHRGGAEGRGGSQRGFGGYGLTVSEGEKGPGVLLPPVIGNLQVLDQTFRRRAVFYRRFRDFGGQ